MKLSGGARWALMTLGIGAVRRVARRARAIDFEDRVVLITGGSRGLGLLLARQLGAAGARLVILARDGAEVRRAEEDLRGRGATVWGRVADVRNPAEATAAVADTVAHFGQLDVLINNAGVIMVGPAEHMTIEDYEEAMGVHFWGPLHLIRAAVPHLRRKRQGRIVNIASIGGKFPAPHLSAYCASKFALVGLSDTLGAELAKDGIRVTTVNPGLMRTGSHLNAILKGRHAAEFALGALLDSSPLTSIAAQRAARQIVDACRYGDRELTITIQAQVAARFYALFPALTADLLAIVARLMPQPTGPSGDRRQTGWESQSPVAPSLLTSLADRATVANNEVPSSGGHDPLHDGL
ncbi:MAG TPA: SDR family NAD(P)-dependent oxidoreductase [Chloroflexia bacterium]|nr:SDR family NAD(P)-dependent oxidoreductase [Chloroflexia bacterium]